jgi:hypothetical protein
MALLAEKTLLQNGVTKKVCVWLLFSALGAAAMIIAVNANTFAGMLAGLFIVHLVFRCSKQRLNLSLFRWEILLQVWVA